MLSISELNKRIKGRGRLYWAAREAYVVAYLRIAALFDRKKIHAKKRILFYHINSLGFAGTEKFIQILAKHIDKEKYEVYYMHPSFDSSKKQYQDRLDYILSGHVIPIPFEYDHVRGHPPYFAEGMNPDVASVIKGLGIDLLVTPASGHADYPFSVIRSIPIILLNIFGQPNVQRNIRYHLGISQEVVDRLAPIVPGDKARVFPVPSENPPANAPVLGRALRARLGISDDQMVFGRIGRSDEGIFDPIGIRAFREVLKKRDDVHYVIMSAPGSLKKIVADENIRNVHFIDPSADDNDVWAFHGAIDALAHFRLDGESFGLNIVESMLSGKPIISHKSHIWNAHLEYLDNSFSRVADRNDVEAYARFMLEFAEKKASGELTKMGEAARVVAMNRFHIDSNIRAFQEFIEESIR